MKFAFVVLCVIVLCERTFVLSDVVDYAGLLLPDKEPISCYSCSSSVSPECFDIGTGNITRFITKCDGNAVGCLKKLIKIENYTVINRDCYYGEKKIINLFKCYHNGKVEKSSKCYECYNNLCNSSNSIEVQLGIVLIFSLYIAYF
ncbi:uncharacterized protein LOC142225462 isoform X2 [Haematobia irritans]|uniref:uncharacterized protein LOC142225462 isoform X2 n=1 Tax=Haematobia irritans TaxID=7368 RepID=UPI003F50C17E